MNATKTATNRAFAIISVLALVLCSFAAIFATDSSDAAEYSSLVTSGDKINQEYTLDISTGQLFSYANVKTNLDGYGSIAYTWTGTAADSTGTNGIKWDESAKTLSGTFTSAGNKSGVLTATWTAPAGNVTQTASQTINFNITTAIDVPTTVTGYAQVGSTTADTTMTISFVGSGNLSLEGGNPANVPFAATMSGNTITIKPTKTLAESDVTGSPYTFSLKVKNAASGDEDSVEVNLYVFDKIAITNTTTHHYTYEGDLASSIIVDGINVSISYETDNDDNTTCTGKTVEFTPSAGNVISGDLTANNKLTVNVKNGFTNAGDLTGGQNSKDYTAKVTANGSIPTSEGGTGATTSSASVDFIVTVYKSFQFTSAPAVSDITVTSVGANSNTVLLSSYISGANSVRFEWGDGVSTAPMTSSEVSSNYTSTHTYAAPGTYLVTIYATNDMGTTTSKVMYSVGDDGTTTPTDPDDSEKKDKSFIDEHGWIFIVFIVLTIVLGIVYFAFFNHPFVLVGAIICAILAVLTFVYVDFGGIVDALKGLFTKE